MQLVELQNIAATLDEHGIAPFAISYDSVDTLAAFAAKYGIGFPLLADEGSKVITALGMLDEHLDKHHAEMGGTVRDDQRGVCYPGVFLIDERGVVTQRRFQRNYRVRESGAALLELALGITPSQPPTGVELPRPRVLIRAHVDSPTYWRYQRLYVIVDLEIAAGSHVYAPPTPKDYVSLSVDLSGNALEAGAPLLPDATPFHIEGPDEQFWVYDGRVRIVVPFEFILQRGDDMGERTVNVQVRYQSCDEATCDPPDEARFDLQVNERPAAD